MCKKRRKGLLSSRPQVTRDVAARTTSSVFVDGEKLMDTVQMAHPSASRGLPIPSDFAPEGIEERLVDENTLYLVRNALPEIYYQIFLHLLYYATTDPRSSMQPSLFAKVGGESGEAIILYRSVAELSKSPHSPAGPETYHKAILILEALKIIRRIFHRGFTEVRMPLGRREILIPALLRSLRELHGDEKRKGYRNVKVKQLARKVARRLQSGEFLAGIPHPGPRPLDLKDVLTHLLLSHGIPANEIQPSRLSETCTVLAQAIRAAKNGRVLQDSGEHVRASTRAAWGRMGDSSDHAGDSSPQQGRAPSSDGAASQEHAGEFPVTESPALPLSCHRAPGRRRKKGDLDAIFGKESPETDENLPIVVDAGDSPPAVSMIALSLRDSIGTNETIIDQRAGASTPAAVHPPGKRDRRPLEEIRREVKFYESFFDNGRSRHWTGSLFNMICETTPEARRQAAVGAIYYSYFPQPDGRKVYSPGGWFTSACRRYSESGGAVPLEVRTWSETNLPLKEIRRRIKEGSRLPEERALPWEEGEQEAVARNDEMEFDACEDLLGEQASGIVGRAEESFDDDAQTAYPLPVDPTRSYMANWMDAVQAERLRDRILREGEVYRLCAVVRPGQGERCTVIVTWPGHPGEIEIINEEDWIGYFRDVKECLDELE
jgi:hypothetical protein